MRSVVVLAEAAEDLEEARRFYDAREVGVGAYFVTSLLADIESLALHHGIHRQQHGCFRMLASRFPFGIYYQEAGQETRVVAVLDLRRHPSWVRRQVAQRPKAPSSRPGSSGLP
jgi:plasmid stabilization system protein ParE